VPRLEELRNEIVSLEERALYMADLANCLDHQDWLWRAHDRPERLKRLLADEAPGEYPAPRIRGLANSAGSIEFLAGWRGRHAHSAMLHRGRGRGRARSRAAGCIRLLSHCPGCRIRRWHGGSPHSVPSGYRKSKIIRWSLRLAFGGYGGAKWLKHKSQARHVTRLSGSPLVNPLSDPKLRDSE
jgi:hypothetical protein